MSPQCGNQQYVNTLVSTLLSPNFYRLAKGSGCKIISQPAFCRGPLTGSPVTEPDGPRAHAWRHDCSFAHDRRKLSPACRGIFALIRNHESEPRFCFLVGTHTNSRTTLTSTKRVSRQFVHVPSKKRFQSSGQYHTFCLSCAGIAPSSPMLILSLTPGQDLHWCPGCNCWSSLSVTCLSRL